MSLQKVIANANFEHKKDIRTINEGPNINSNANFEHRWELEGLEFIEKYFDEFNIFTRDDPDVWEVIYKKVPRLLEKYISNRIVPGGLTKKQYVFGQLVRYRLKMWMARSDKSMACIWEMFDNTERGGNSSHTTPEPSYTNNNDILEVSILIEGLSEEDGKLLWWRYAEGYTLEELAEFYKVSRPAIRLRVLAALRRAKELVANQK